MKTKRILITLSLDYGINMMGFESSLTREQISVNNPELTVLSLREFCMLSKENLLRMDVLIKQQQISMILNMLKHRL